MDEILEHSGNDAGRGHLLVRHVCTGDGRSGDPRQRRFQHHGD